jgi:hydroxymethylbilane synthase
VSTKASRTIRVATRVSRLALWQAEHVAELLRAAAPDALVELVHVTTSGDRDQTGALRSFGGIGVFTREVQRAVLDGRADLAVHSLKDLPTESAAGLALAAVPERETTSDALVLPAAKTGAKDLARLPMGARVGTGSLRRRAQLLYTRSDLALSEVRGNVETRIAKLDAGDYDALVLALAGLKRLGLAGRMSQELAPPAMYPAVGQGALGVECRGADAELRALLTRIDDSSAHQRVIAERSLLAQLRAGCHAPVGAATEIDSGELTLEAVVLSADGRQRLIASGQSAPNDAEKLGREVAEKLLQQGADVLLEP